MSDERENRFRYGFEKYKGPATKKRCPDCGKRTFTMYVDRATGEYISEYVGRCDREIKCGYHNIPWEYFSLNRGSGIFLSFDPVDSVTPTLPPIKFPDPEKCLTSICHGLENTFSEWIINMFGTAGIDALLRFKAGTSKKWGMSPVILFH